MYRACLLSEHVRARRGLATGLSDRRRNELANENFPDADFEEPEENDN